MIKKLLTNLKIEDAHPSAETLLKCVDGELSPQSAARIRAHLETCWTCRAQLDKIEETISLFVDFRRSIQMPLAMAPPSNWGGFDDKLAKLAAEKDTEKSRWRNSLTLWQKFFSFSSMSNLSPFRIRAFAGTVAAILIAALLWQLISVQTVSAYELLERSVAAQMEKTGATPQAVVYQKLQVKRQNAPVINLEIWQDTTRPRFRRLVNQSNAESKPENTTPNVLGELSETLRSNGWNPQQPLSPVSFKKWRDSLIDKTEEVSQTTNDGGMKFLALRTINNSAANTGQIIEAVLKVRQSDWHPVAQSLRVKTVSGEEIYEFTELDFRVESLTAFQPDFFDEPVAPQITVATAAAVAPKVSSSPAANASPQSSPSVVESPVEVVKTEPAPLKVVASADLEVEILRLLNQAKADLGEQITVKREADGLLYVRGIVETTTRKTEILSHLDPVKNNPAVRVEINTVAEAVAKEGNKPQTPAKVETVETQSSSVAAENDLIEHFGSTDAARTFAAQTVSRSGRAMSHAYALKRLVGQFKPEELRSLSPAARAKWLALVSSHARAFGEETESLQRELQPIFAVPNTSAAVTPAVKNAADVPQAIETLFDLASANNRVVRSAMTVSAGDAQFSAIKTAQFWQSLKSAEALASKLQTIR